MIEKRYYTAATLEDALARYEAEYSMTSAEFFDAHRSDSRVLEGMPGFQRGTWAGLWQELHGFDESGHATDDVVVDETHEFRLAV